jgi:hypothetical protein
MVSRFKVQWLAKHEHADCRWVTGFAEQLRPKLVHGRYQGTPGWWHNVTLDPETALWGGEVAAAKLTKHLKPQDVILYVDRQKPNAILTANKLKSDRMIYERYIVQLVQEG